MEYEPYRTAGCYFETAAGCEDPSHRSLGTVYRNLEQMSQAGLIRKLETAGKQKRFDGDISEHFHMRCRVCGAVVDIESEKLRGLSAMIRKLLPELGCDSFNLELSGCCGGCKEETMVTN